MVTTVIRHRSGHGETGARRSGTLEMGISTLGWIYQDTLRRERYQTQG